MTVAAQPCDRLSTHGLGPSVWVVGADAAGAERLMHALAHDGAGEIHIVGPVCHAAALESALQAGPAPRLAILVTAAAPPGSVAAGVEAQLRALLTTSRTPYAVVDADAGHARAQAALRAALQPPAEPPRWRWVCADCDDAECESHPAGGHPARGLLAGREAPPAAELPSRDQRRAPGMERTG